MRKTTKTPRNKAAPKPQQLPLDPPAAVPAQVPSSDVIEQDLEALARMQAALPEERRAALQKLLNKTAYTVQEAGGLLGVGPAAIRAAIKRGEIRSFRIGSRWRIPASEIIKRLIAP